MKEFYPFRLDTVNECLWKHRDDEDDERIRLTPKAFAVLRYLVERAGRLVTQNELLNALWPNTFVQPEVLKSHILDVRSALGDRPKNPLFIETMHRRGYRFIAFVRNPANEGRLTSPLPMKESVGQDAALTDLRDCLEKIVLVGRPESLRQHIEHQIERLSVEQKRVLEFASVLLKFSLSVAFGAATANLVPETLEELGRPITKRIQ